MQTNNNPLPEIGVILIALSFIAAGTILLALRDIDLNTAISLWILAASVAGINVALKAPSPTQQQLLVQALASQAQPQLVQAPAPVATPKFVPLTGFPLPTPASMPGAGTFTAMPQAIMTTQASMPAVPKQ